MNTQRRARAAGERGAALPGMDLTMTTSATMRNEM
jgi:hypothetical protein